MKEEIDQVLLMVKCGLMKLKKSNKEKLYNRKITVMQGMDMDVVEIF
jgi:hypothetical protein